jgi:hypothetical protein
LVFQEQDFCRQRFWGGIVLQYVSYRLQGKWNKSESDDLEQSMMIVVRNGRALQRFTNKKVNPSFEADAEDEINSLESSPVSGLVTMIDEINQSL